MELILKNICKSYGDKKVLENFNLHLKDEKICLIGRSGSGKTTLIKIISGQIRPDKGQIISSEPLKPSIVFQDNLLFENKSVRENFSFVKELTDFKYERELNQVGLFNLLDMKVGELSGGMKRRISFIRASIYEGNILLMDEAIREVDEDTRILMLNYINKNLKSPLIYVSHRLEDAEILGARVINIE